MAVQGIRIYNPYFLEQDANGLPAAGYLVWTLEAGSVDTLVDTYLDKDLLTKNTNPVVLNLKGEANIFTDLAQIKLVFTAPGSDLTSPIWTQDNISGVGDTLTATGQSVGTTDNIYAVNTVPAFVSTPDDFRLIFTPDVDSEATIGSVVFTGSGQNDISFGGAYVGSTPGSIFQVEIDSIFIMPPASAPIVHIPALAGVVTAGNHTVAVTFLTATGETSLGAPSVIIDMTGTNTLGLSNVPLGPVGTTGRNIYMTKAGGSDYFLAGTLSDNTTDILNVNVADADLTQAAPTDNSTGDGVGGDTVKWRKDSGAYTAGVPLTGTDQVMIEGVSFRAVQTSGHTIGDMWSVTVMTPAKLNFCGLGAFLIYKSLGGKLVPLDAGDIIAGIPVNAIWSASQSCWCQINPSLPAYLSSSAVASLHGIIELTGTPWVCPAGVTLAYVTGTAPGGGGGGGANGQGGNAGESVFKKAVVVVPGTSYPNALGDVGSGGADGSTGQDATDATFDSVLTLTGGTGGATGGSGVTAGQDNFYGKGGAAGSGSNGGAGDTGAGGGGGDGAYNGGNGGPGRLILEW